MAAPTAEAGGVSAGGAGAQAGGALPSLRCALGCRRRSPAEEERLAIRAYEALLARGRQLDSKQQQWYDKLCWWSDAATKQGTRIFCIAPRGPKGQAGYSVDTWEFWAYCLAKMHEHVVVEGRTFAFVWVQLSDHRLWPLEFRRLRAALHPSYGAKLEALHVVHPSWTVRVLRILLWPIAEDELWDRFHAHERVEFLDSFVEKKFRLPKDIYEYDRWLDKQAQEMTEQANKRFGAAGGAGMFSAGSPGDEAQKQSNEEVEAMKRILQQRGMGGADPKSD